MKAKLLYRKKEIRPDGVVEMVVWQLPDSSSHQPHGIKYRFYAGRMGKCLVRYDNETGKGDHIHYGKTEISYSYVSMTKLVSDFLSDVERLSGGSNGE